MLDAAPDYSVVIPAWNEEALLKATLDSVRGAMSAVRWEGEIVVCDNNSTDRTADVARAQGARVVFEPHNQISRARNTGAGAARGRWLVFVDADTRISGATLGAAVEQLSTEACVGGGSVLQMDCSGSRTGDRFVRFWTWISRRFQIAAGSFLFVRRDAFDAVGGFSTSVYAGEEIWLTRALKRWGRSRGMSFRVLDGDPVATSGRKMAWHSAASLVGTFALFAVFPFLTRSRWFCGHWYRRPATEKQSHHANDRAGTDPES